MFTKGSKYWKCQCGSKNDVLEDQFCTKCHLDQFGNKNYVRNVNEVIEKLEEINDPEYRNKTIKELNNQIEDIEAAFANNELDYGRKLILIERRYKYKRSW